MVKASKTNNFQQASISRW